MAVGVITPSMKFMLFVSFSPIYGLSLPCVLSSSIELEAFHQYILWAFLVSDFSTQPSFSYTALNTRKYNSYIFCNPINHCHHFILVVCFFMCQKFVLDFSMGVCPVRIPAWVLSPAKLRPQLAKNELPFCVWILNVFRWIQMKSLSTILIWIYCKWIWETPIQLI